MSKSNFRRLGPGSVVGDCVYDPFIRGIPIRPSWAHEQFVPGTVRDFYVIVSPRYREGFLLNSKSLVP